MTGEPKINTDEVKTRLNGTFSGSGTTGSYCFFEEYITSGSLWDTISGSSTQLRVLVGNGIMDSTDTDTVRQVKEAELLMACFNTLVMLSGGVIVSGFSWKAGVSVDNSGMLAAYKNIIDGYKKSAQDAVRQLQDNFYMADTDVPDWAETSSSRM